MDFDHAIIDALLALGPLLKEYGELYLRKQEELASAFDGKEGALEDIIYDFDDAVVRLEAMMICKLMPKMEKLRIFQDLSLAEKDPRLRQWGGILYRQEHLLDTAKQFAEEKRRAEQEGLSQ